MNTRILTMDEIKSVVKPLAKKYNVEAIYLFGSYARGEAEEDSDLDFLILCGRHCEPKMVFALQEELYQSLGKPIDAFEICEIDQDSEFYKTIQKERVLVA